MVESEPLLCVILSKAVRPRRRISFGFRFRRTIFSALLLSRLAVTLHHYALCIMHCALEALCADKCDAYRIVSAHLRPAKYDLRASPRLGPALLEQLPQQR